MTNVDLDAAAASASKEDLEKYKHVRVFETDYDRAQGEIRRAATLWVLAGFAAISFTFFSPEVGTTIPRSLLGVLITWSSVFGVLLLWYVDQRVYQKLLHSAFVYGMYLEYIDAANPQIRTMMYNSNFNVSTRLSYFYIIPALAFFAVLLFFAFAYLPESIVAGVVLPPETHNPIRYGLAVTAGVALAFAMLRTHYRPDLITEVGADYPEEFKSYLRQGSYKARLVAAPRMTNSQSRKSS